MATVMELENLKKRLADNKQEQSHLDKVIQEMKDEGWEDLSPSEKAFVHRIEDKCKSCGNNHDDCNCGRELEEPTNSIS